MRAKWFIFILGITAILASPAISATEITGDYRHTGTIPQDDFVIYHINMTKPGKILDVTVTASDPVDFYLLTEKELSQYMFSDAFAYEDYSENTTTYHWRGTGDYYLVIDNANVSVSGAMSHGPVNYTIVAKLEDKGIYDTLVDSAAYLVCGTLIVIAAATTFWLYKKPKIEEVLK